MGAGGFLGSHLVRRLKAEGLWVRGADLHYPPFSDTAADDFLIGDLRNKDVCSRVIDRPFDEVYQLAADMGGAGYIFTGEHDAGIMSNSAAINLNIATLCHRCKVGRVFYSSSACIYPAHNQQDPDARLCGSLGLSGGARQRIWLGKAFSERLFLAHNRNHNLGAAWRVPQCLRARDRLEGGRKRPSRDLPQGGDGHRPRRDRNLGRWAQTRSFLYIEDCLEGTIRLTRSGFEGPVNIGSDEMVTINQLVDMVSEIAGKTLHKKHIPGPTGIRGRNSDNRLIAEKLGWRPEGALYAGLEKTYQWVEAQVRRGMAA